MFVLMSAWADEPFYLDGKIIVADRREDLDELTSWFFINECESPVKVISQPNVPYMTFEEAWDFLEAERSGR